MLGTVARFSGAPDGGDRLFGIRLFAGRLWSVRPCALPRPLDYMTDEAVTVLPAVLAAIGAPRHVLFGHSDGATIAAHTRAASPTPASAG